MQEEILQSNPDGDIAVYVVWFNVLATDSRGGWDSGLLRDARVTEYWDSEGITGPWFFGNKETIGFEFFGGAVVWDASFLFGPSASWDKAPTQLEHFGYTVIGDSDSLRDQIDALWSNS